MECHFSVISVSFWCHFCVIFLVFINWVRFKWSVILMSFFWSSSIEFGWNWVSFWCHFGVIFLVLVSNRPLKLQCWHQLRKWGGQSGNVAELHFVGQLPTAGGQPAAELCPSPPRIDGRCEFFRRPLPSLRVAECWRWSFLWQRCNAARALQVVEWAQQMTDGRAAQGRRRRLTLPEPSPCVRQSFHLAAHFHRIEGAQDKGAGWRRQHRPPPTPAKATAVRPMALPWRLAPWMDVHPLLRKMNFAVECKFFSEEWNRGE